MKQLLALVLVALLCNSCATLFNGKNTKVNIHAPKHTKVTYNNTTQNIEEGLVSIFPKRSKDSLKFTLTNDSISQTFTINKLTSGKLFINLLTPYSGIIGVLVDLTNPKRFTYKRNLYFEIDSLNQRLFTPYLEPINFKRHDIFIYNTPLKLIDLFAQPMFTIGAEYFFINTMSFSAEYGTVFSKRLGVGDTDFNIVNEKGRSFRYELKYYNLVRISTNPRVNEYIGIEGRFLRFQFNDNISYNRSVNDINFNINEIIAVQESINIFNLKYGLNYPIGEHFYLDAYTGFGVRIRTVKNPNSNFNSNTDRLQDEDNSFFNFRQSNVEGVNDSQEFNFSLGFKFGYKF